MRSDLDPEIAAAVIMGTIVQYCCKKVAFYHTKPENMDFSKVVDTVMNGIGTPDRRTRQGDGSSV